MDFKKISLPLNLTTWDTSKLAEPTGNLYESIMIISKRSNQISKELKEELNQKLKDFSSFTDNLEEVFENREQIEISKYYERLPKPTIIAANEFDENRVYFRNSFKEDETN